MKQFQDVHETEGVVRIYEDIPMADDLGSVRQIIEKGLKDPTYRPWVETGLKGLGAVADLYPKAFERFRHLIDGLNEHILVSELTPKVEEDIAKSRAWIPFLMPMGTRFEDEEFIDPNSEIGKIIEVTRLWYRTQMGALEVNNLRFPQVTLFTLPKDLSKRATMTILGTTLPTAKVENVASEDIATLEEGLALHWSERCRMEVLAKMYPEGHHFYQNSVARVTQEHPELSDVRLFVRPEKLREGTDENARTFIVSINDYSLGRDVVTMLINDIPDFLTLAEQARIDGKTLALARVIEQKYGTGSYRKFVIGKLTTANFKKPISSISANQEQNNTMDPENHLSGMACGNSVFIEAEEFDPELPEHLKQLALYQMGMIAAEEIYHSLAPIMVHVNTRSCRLNYRVERRGLNYTANKTS